MQDSILTNGGQRVAIPHLSQYFGLWLHEPNRLSATIEMVHRMNLSAHVAEGAPLVRESATIIMEGGTIAEWDKDARLLRIDNVVLIDLEGTLTKYGSSMSAAGSTITARRELARAVRDDKVDAIVLRIDSPGGTFAGTDDLAGDVAEANKVKPVVAYIEDLGASAAYFIASQAGRIIMNKSGEVGSIGVFMLVYDTSEAAAQQGIKAVLITAGEMKGAGAPGTEITAAQQAEWQRSVNEAYDQFVGAVARGRGMSTNQARGLADGRLWGASDALSKGLIDEVATMPEAIRFAQNEKDARINRAVLGIKGSKTAKDNPLLEAVDAAARLQQASYSDGDRKLLATAAAFKKQREANK